MPRILVVGYDPATVDSTDPAIEQLHADIPRGMQRMRDRGWEVDGCSIQPDASAGPTVERRLASATYDCVVIAAGIRLPPPRLVVFEAVVNAVHKAAPGASIAFNISPLDSAEAAARWLPS